MRRWLIVLIMALLATALMALPGVAEEKPLPDTVEFTGEVRYGAIEARTGEYAGDVIPPPLVAKWSALGWEHLMDPNFNKCIVYEATLEWIGRNTALLTTKEDCSARDPLPGPTAHHKIVHITPSGAVKMSPNMDFPVMWNQVPMLTGCAATGTFPIYHGYFDGQRFYAAAHYNGFCEGGTAWAKFGIGAEDGPIHVTYEFDLTVTD